MSSNRRRRRPARPQDIDAEAWDGTIPDGYPEWWHPGLQMPSWWKPGMPLGDESIELDEEDERILDRIWDEIAREDRERLAREQGSAGSPR
jgi:hypothetical protein